MALLIAAITLGFFGSFHCIGMCGPIALALPIHQFSPLKKYIGILLYNFGRVITYTLLGLLFGLLGQTFFLGGLQQALSITLGILLLLGLIATYTQWFQTPQLQFIYQAVNSLKNQLGNLFNKQGLHFLFFIGLLNGLLPCGLVYLGIAGAVATGSFDKGALFMFYFGLGTIPMMYAVAYLGQFVSMNFRNVIKRAMPFVIATMAILLILRGLNLGIPYVSPVIEQQSSATGKMPPVINCH